MEHMPHLQIHLISVFGYQYTSLATLYADEGNMKGSRINMEALKALRTASGSEQSQRSDNCMLATCHLRMVLTNRVSVYPSPF